MSSELDLDAGLAKLKIDLSEFLSAVRDLVAEALGAQEREGARNAIKAMIEEVRKTFDTVVNMLTPLYGIASPQQFDRDFGPIYAGFKRVYLSTSDVARAHCHVVRQYFEQLQNRRRWMQHLPLANGAFDRLERVCREWLTSDADIVYRLASFFDTLNGFLDEMADLRTTSSVKAFETLSGGLRRLEHNFRGIQAGLGELDALGRSI